MRKFSAGKFSAGIFSAGIGSVFAFTLAIAPARADDVPVLHVEQICHGIVKQSGDSLSAGDPKVAFSQCMDAEAKDRETLVKEWPTFAADDKRHCTAETTMGGESSYTELVTCLEMARDVRKLREPQAPQSQPSKKN
jgi:hypothetical protein